MARTFIRQESQIRPSLTFDDTLAAGIALQTGSASIEGDLNSLRSQTKRVLGEANWYAALSGRSLSVLSTDLADIEGKKQLRRVQVLTDVGVTAAQNWEILSVAASEAPTQVAAVAGGVNGAVVAQSALNGAGFNVHELIELAGQNAISPKNLVLVRDSTTGQKIQSAGKDIFGLLQFESTGVDGAAFDDVSAGARVKISFVIMNAGLDDLIACPVGDIAGKTINYSYVSRFNFDAILEDAWLSPEAAFIDQAAAVDVTRQRAYDNQGTTAVELATDADLDLALTKAWAIRDALDADLLQVIEGTGGGASEVKLGTDVDVFNVDAILNDFANGIRARTGGTRPVHVGVNDGVVESSAGDLRVMGFGELFLDDGNQAGSTWAQTSGIKLSDTMAEWDAFETSFGEVSLLAAITAAAGIETKTFANVTAATVLPNVDVGGVAGGANLDAQLPDMSTGTFLRDYDTYVNGELIRPGADAAANNDYYPGTSLVNGQLKFEFTLIIGDVLCVVKKK